MDKNKDLPFSLEELESIILARRDSTAGASYTRSLLDKGLAHCGKKFGEEAVEFAMATAKADTGAMAAEAADVLYHLLVALQAGGIPLQSVLNVLGQRTRMSGHEEKAARG
jgi:phosphoribosyl-ATP pyrophosphohydrolase